MLQRRDLVLVFFFLFLFLSFYFSSKLNNEKKKIEMENNIENKIQPPVPKQVPKKLEIHNHVNILKKIFFFFFCLYKFFFLEKVRIDNYYWMNERENPVKKNKKKQNFLFYILFETHKNCFF